MLRQFCCSERLRCRAAVSGVVRRAMCSNSTASAAKVVPNGTANGTFVSSYNNLTDKQDIITYLQRFAHLFRCLNRLDQSQLNVTPQTPLACEQS